MEFNDTINYVHGCILDGNIILGTKDEKIAHNYDFIQKSFDSQCTFLYFCYTYSSEYAPYSQEEGVAVG